MNHSIHQSAADFFNSLLGGKCQAEKNSSNSSIIVSRMWHLALLRQNFFDGVIGKGK